MEVEKDKLVDRIFNALISKQLEEESKIEQSPQPESHKSLLSGKLIQDLINTGADINTEEVAKLTLQEIRTKLLEPEEKSKPLPMQQLTTPKRVFDDKIRNIFASFPLHNSSISLEYTEDVGGITRRKLDFLSEQKPKQEGESNIDYAVRRLTSNVDYFVEIFSDYVAHKTASELEHRGVYAGSRGMLDYRERDQMWGRQPVKVNLSELTAVYEKPNPMMKDYISLIKSTPKVRK